MRKLAERVTQLCGEQNQVLMEPGQSGSTADAVLWMPERGDRCRELNELNIFSASLWVILRLVLISIVARYLLRVVFLPSRLLSSWKEPHGFILALHWLAQCWTSSFLHSFIDTANFCWTSVMDQALCWERDRLWGPPGFYPEETPRRNEQDVDFPGGPVVKMPCFHCRGRGFIPGQETKTLRAAKIPRIIKILLVVRLLSPCHLSRRLSTAAPVLLPGQVQTQSRAHLWHLLSDRCVIHFGEWTGPSRPHWQAPQAGTIEIQHTAMPEAAPCQCHPPSSSRA